MRTGLHLLMLAAIGLGVTAAVEASAQVVEGVDAGRLRGDAKRAAPDAKLFADEVRRRGEAVREEALRTRAAAMANRMPVTGMPGKPGGGVLDFDRIIADAGRITRSDAQKPGPRFIVFASMAMPVGSLRTMIRETTAAGGVVVFRGLPQNSAKAFLAAMKKLVDKAQSTRGIGIDPRLFRAFEISAVPTYVVTTGEFTLCDGFSCRTALPPHDRLAGNVTPGYALDRFAAGGGPGAAAAKLFARRLAAAGKDA